MILRSILPQPPERSEGELVEIPKASKGPSSDKHEPLEPGDGALEPRRISIPLPGSEVVAMTPAYRKMLQRLEDKVELYKLHVKHYHMSPTQFRRRVSMLKLPDSVLEKYESVVRSCRVFVTLQWHLRHEPESPVLELHVLVMLFLLIIVRLNFTRTSISFYLFLMVPQIFSGLRHRKTS